MVTKGIRSDPPAGGDMSVGVAEDLGWALSQLLGSYSCRSSAARVEMLGPAENGACVSGFATRPESINVGPASPRRTAPDGTSMWHLRPDGEALLWHDNCTEILPADGATTASGRCCPFSHDPGCADAAERTSSGHLQAGGAYIGGPQSVKVASGCGATIAPAFPGRGFVRTDSRVLLRGAFYCCTTNCEGLAR